VDRKLDFAQGTMRAPDTPVILGDIGGTTARFAVLTGADLSDVAHMHVADYPDFNDALATFLGQYPPLPRPCAAIFAVAGPVEHERCALVNNRWIIEASELRKIFDLSDVHLVNDFEATAWSLPSLAKDDLFPLGDGTTVGSAPMAIIGPGTGLGVAGFIPDPLSPRVIATEAGHTTLPSCTPREDVVIHALRQQFGHVSSERALSGAGIENLYRELAKIDGASVPQRSAAEITQAAVTGNCAVCRAALDMFCAMLGTVAGNVALGFGARGGVYIAGGIVPRIADFVRRSAFRERFESKGRLSPYVHAIPSYVIMHPDVAFLGLQTLARRKR
jgi:glucokinase